MDRKQALKELKKQKRDYNNEEEKNIINRFVMTIGIVLLALVALYLFIGIFVTKTITFGKDKENDQAETTLDKTTILAGQIFNQKNDEYYVLVFDPEEKIHNLNGFLDIYKSKTNSIPVYKVDSTKKFNSKYIVEENSNTNPTGYNDLRIKDPTLIKITSGSVSEYYEGYEEVKNVFKN